MTLQTLDTTIKPKLVERFSNSFNVFLRLFSWVVYLGPVDDPSELG